MTKAEMILEELTQEIPGMRLEDVHSTVAVYWLDKTKHYIGIKRSGKKTLCCFGEEGRVPLNKKALSDMIRKIYVDQLTTKITQKENQIRLNRNHVKKMKGLLEQIQA